MVQQFFSPTDASTILSIPFSFRLPCDRMAWAFTPKGDFMVRSAYKLALEMVHDGNSGEASNNQSNKLFWKIIWRLNIPNKVKSFAWCASKKIIPTKANLCHRKVIDNPTCEACGLGVESSGHVLWDCEKAQEIWKLSSIPFEVCGANFPEFLDFLWYLKFGQKMRDDLLELVVMVAWCLWFNRNEVRLGKGRLPSLAILQKARYMLDKFQTANLKLSQTSLKEEVRWEPPGDMWYKINSDAALLLATIFLVGMFWKHFNKLASRVLKG